MLKQDIESFYKLIAENKHDHTITPSKRKKKINHIFFLGKSCCSKPLYIYYIINQGIMKQYNALFSQESVVLYQMPHTDPDKIDQHLADLLSLLSLPCMLNSKNN